MKHITNIDNLINNNTVSYKKFAKLCREYVISSEIYDKYCNILPWNIICKTQQLSSDIINRHSTHINWSNLCQYQLVEHWIINKYKNDVDWKVISQYQKLSQDFLIHWNKYLYWKIVCKYQTLDEGFINYMINNDDDSDICNSQFCDDHAFREKKCVIYINLILKHQKLSDNFIVDCIDYLDVWINNKEDLVALHIKIDDDIKYQPISGWDALPYVFYEKTLSPTFIKKYWKNMHPHMLSKYQKIPESLILDTGNYIKWNWKYLSQQHLSEKVLETFYHKLHWEHVFNCKYTSQAFRNKWGKTIRSLTVFLHAINLDEDENENEDVNENEDENKDENKDDVNEVVANNYSQTE